MASFDFPATPALDDEYTLNGVTYKFNGVGWVLEGSASGGLIIADAPPAGAHGDLWWESDTGILWVYFDDGTSAQWVQAAGSGGGAPPVVATAPQGRLTLQAGSPVMTTSVPGATTLYYSAYHGDKVPIFDGTDWEMVALPGGEISVTPTLGVDKINDWYIWDNGGALQLINGADWTSDTARAQALARVGGLLVNGVAIAGGPAAQRGTFVGTTRSNAAGALDHIAGGGGPGGTAIRFCVWNAYNRVPAVGRCTDSTASWTISVGQRAANGSANMRASAICGLPESPVRVIYAATCSSAPAGYMGLVGIGWDSASGFSGTFTNSGDDNWNPIFGELQHSGVQGWHYYQALESVQAGGSVNFLGFGAGGVGGYGTGLWFSADM